MSVANKRGDDNLEESVRLFNSGEITSPQGSGTPVLS